MASTAPGALRVGLGNVVRVAGVTGPAATAYTRAPRAAACSSDSSTTIPAPSPSTKPSRPLSNGREARSGSSLRSDRARMAANAAMFSSMIAASVPPATTMSARPFLIMSMP